MNNTLQNTELFFKRAFPNPGEKNKHTQLGVHCEEVVEMLKEVAPMNEQTEALLDSAMKAMHELADHLKAGNNLIFIEETAQPDFLDALCDQIATCVGVAHMFGYDVVGAMNAVNASNFSKFVNGNPIYDRNLKLSKGPDYFKPNIARYVKR